MNPILKELEWTIDLLGWEDRLPGYGRPQEQINEDVDACDLFVGLLWRRWGMPTGAFESGFEEELERARERRKKSETPEIWIYFKTVDPEIVKDPGEQLRRVLAFKDQLSRGHELLYSEFSTAEEWQKSFHDRLLQYVIRQHKRELAEEASQKEARTSTSISTSSDFIPSTLPNVATDGEPAPRQLHDILSILANCSSRVTVEQFQSVAEGLSLFEVTRLYLQAATWVSRFGTNEPLSNHAANLVFQHRQQIELTPWERDLLIRSMINEGNHYVPGWYWTKDLSDEDTEASILLATFGNNDEEFRVAALRFLTKNVPRVGTHIPHNELIERLIVNQTESVVTEALHYAGQFCTDEIIDEITKLKDHETPSVANTAEEAILNILVRLTPEKALKRIVANASSVDQKILTQLHDQPTLEIQDLLNALHHPSGVLRALSVSELHARHKLPEETAKQLLKDSWGPVRALGIQKLIELHKAPDPEEIRNLLKEVESKTGLGFSLVPSKGSVNASDLVRKLFETFSYEELEKKVDWISLDGPIAYQVLAMLHFERWENRVRSDLKDQFSSFYEHEKQRLYNTFGEQAETIIDSFSKKDLNRFITAEFYGAALNGLLNYATREDAELARPYLDSNFTETQLAAVKFIAKVGDPSDVESLVSVAKNSYGEVANQAAVAAITLSQDQWVLVCRFLRDGNAALVDSAIDWLLHAPVIPSWETLELSLYEKNDRVRMGVTRVFSVRLSADKLESLLDRYPHGSSTYYYDVIVHLDKSLYAPKAWRPANPKQTEEKT